MKSDSLWFTSDLHFFHKNVIKYCNRPWTAEEQTEKLIEIWNTYVSEDHDVFHLGDFAFAHVGNVNAVKDILVRLNGKKHFILGNHCDKRLWHEIHATFRQRANIRLIENYHEIKIDKRNIVLCHYPMRAWNRSHYGSWQLHGHCHGTMAPIGRQLDVGLDNAIKILGDYRPFSFEDVKEFMQNRPIPTEFQNTQPE